MLTIVFIFIMFFWLIPFVLGHLKFIHTLNTLSLTLVFLINDFDNTIISDQLVKLCLMISIMMFALTMFNEINHQED